MGSQLIIASASIVDDTLAAVTNLPDQRSSAPEAVSSQRFAALLLVAALLPAVVATWSTGPLVRVQTALVEASRLPGAIEIKTPVTSCRTVFLSAAYCTAPANSAPLSAPCCTALLGRPDLCATPPPALA